ncbi:restriction endonuclease subunit S, partial [Vibrio anguillarum]|nr:restriction endonuclease subunit S [Vibrio anguillarum]
MIKLGCNTSLPSGWQWAEAGKVIDIRDGTHDSPKPVEVGIPLVTS